jgi:hypothetical protein
MNKFTRSLIALALLMPGIAFSFPFQIPGYVIVEPNNYMQGQMNVRWNETIANWPYIAAVGTAGSDVIFVGQDPEGDFFHCFVSTDRPFYEQAVAIKNSLHDGGMLFVTKSPAGSECTSVYLGNYSYFQH